jgi:hypothetical protein
MSVMDLFRQRRCFDCGMRIKTVITANRYGVDVPVCCDRLDCADRVNAHRMQTFIRVGLMEFCARVVNAQGRSRKWK